MNSRRTLVALALATWPRPAVPAHAQVGDWPRRGPIRFIAVFPPGGSVDQVARILAAQLTSSSGRR